MRPKVNSQKNGINKKREIKQTLETMIEWQTSQNRRQENMKYKNELRKYEALNHNRESVSLPEHRKGSGNKLEKTENRILYKIIIIHIHVDIEWVKN